MVQRVDQCRTEGLYSDRGARYRPVTLTLDRADPIRGSRRNDGSARRRRRRVPCR